MKSKRAQEAIERYRSTFSTTIDEAEETKEYCRLFAEIVELAESDARERAIRAFTSGCPGNMVGQNCVYTDAECNASCNTVNDFLKHYDNE